jgi:tetratricopeptide (TPR) repeat protein
LVLVAAAAILFLYGHDQAEADFERARDLWLTGEYRAATRVFESVRRLHPDSRHAAEALWEIASIYYSHHYDLSEARTHLEELVSRYPTSARVGDALLRLAEIHEAGEYDLAAAVKYWSLVLDRKLSPEERREILYKRGRALLKLEQIDESERDLWAASGDSSDHLSQQAHVCLGTIAQIRGDHREAVRLFEKTRELGRCGECRLQCRLSMIESFEYTGELDRAIEIAGVLDKTGYPKAGELIVRLRQKRDFYADKK